MKHILCSILLVALCSILIGCINNNKDKSEVISIEKRIEKLSTTSIIIIENLFEPSDIKQTITDENTIEEILTILSHAIIMPNDTYVLSIGPNYRFEMHDNNFRVIDKIEIMIVRTGIENQVSSSWITFGNDDVNSYYIDSLDAEALVEIIER